MAIRVLLADDHALFRSGVKSELEMHDDIRVIGEAENGIEAVNLTRKINPDVVIMDVSMPQLNGIEATRRIKADQPLTAIIGLSIHRESHLVKGLLSAGASGFLLKTIKPSSLVRAVREVADGQAYLSPEIAKDIVSDYWTASDPKLEKSEIGRLTPREREVVQLLAEGNKSREAAEILHISVKTVETHRKQIMDKLKIRSLPQLTKWAIRNGLTSLD